jgi:hypothetical protein
MKPTERMSSLSCSLTASLILHAAPQRGKVRPHLRGEKRTSRERPLLAAGSTGQRKRLFDKFAMSAKCLPATDSCTAADSAAIRSFCRLGRAARAEAPRRFQNLGTAQFRGQSDGQIGGLFRPSECTRRRDQHSSDNAKSDIAGRTVGRIGTARRDPVATAIGLVAEERAAAQRAIGR